MTFDVVLGDFLTLLRDPSMQFDLVIMNPPYGKIAKSRVQELRRVGLPVANSYAAFVALGLLSLRQGGDLVAITPRSFANGPYFQSFRDLVIPQVTWRAIHVFESRSAAFRDDRVLQENILFAVTRARPSDLLARVSVSEDPETPDHAVRYLSQAELIDPLDAAKILHLPATDVDSRNSVRIRSLTESFETLGIGVSTGKVVDFRNRQYLSRAMHDNAPLIYPHNLVDGYVQWPVQTTSKAVSFAKTVETRPLLLPAGWYVVVKRFTSKEERRRVVAATYDPQQRGPVAFENHLNVLHSRGGGMPRLLALGLTRYLNSTLVDAYVRQFSGHTQINASDLRRLPLPNLAVIVALASVEHDSADQALMDLDVESTIWPSESHVGGQVAATDGLVAV